MFELSIEQKESFNKLMVFFQNNEREFLLTGFSGSGKTEVISRVLKEQKILDYDEIVVSTPTHKANNVISKRLKGLYKVITIHKLLGFQRSVDENGIIKFLKPPDTEKLPYKLAVIDETSMINSYMYDHLKNTRMKIIFLGDDSQLPPINHGISPTFNIKSR